MGLNFSIYDAPNGSLVADYSARARDLVFATNDHGFAECHGFVPLSLADAFRLYDRPGTPHLVISDSGQLIFEGRVEDVNIARGGVTFGALGYSRAMGDAPYTAMWSNASVADWRPLTGDDVTGGTPERFEMDTQNRLYITPQKNSTQANTNIGAIGYQIPDGSSRSIVGISFDYSFTAPVNWQARFRRGDANFGTLTDPWTLNGTGAAQTGAVHFTLTACQSMQFFLFFNAAAAVFAGETGSAFLKITNVRLVTSITNRIAVAFTANRAAGVNVTATVASTARMYVGQSVQVSNIAGTVSESVTVLSIGSGTQFNATFVNAYVIGDVVQAHVIYADEIAKDLVSTISTLNSAQLQTSTALIQSPGLDLLNETYSDRYPNDILNYLIGLGDNQTIPRKWEWGVYESRFLFFQPESTSNRTWYVDISDLEVERTINALYNSAYGVYANSAGRALRTATSTDPYSPTRYALTRRQAVDASTTSSTQAGIVRSASLTDTATPIPRVAIKIDSVYIYDANGARWPLWFMRAGDTIIIRNLPPTLTASIDRIRSFRLARTEYDVMNKTITVEPESPLPTLDALLARVAAGVQ